MTKTPNPIDQHVGNRVRMRRVMLGFSQEKLGGALGLTFQQVQKYEKGTNRIGASRLQAISKILDVPPSFFFDGAPSVAEAGGEGFRDMSTTPYVPDFLTTAEGLQLNRAFARIRDPKVRKRVVELVAAISESDGQSRPDANRELVV
ncbi:MAG: family transcriptional regulator [Hyphomicrobiales bacterium]|nr:family transcriptional regulator [Hyphomicrobiales bacterium]